MTSRWQNALVDSKSCQNAFNWANQDQEWNRSFHQLLQLRIHYIKLVCVGSELVKCAFITLWKDDDWSELQEYNLSKGKNEHLQVYSQSWRDKLFYISFCSFLHDKHLSLLLVPTSKGIKVCLCCKHQLWTVKTRQFISHFVVATSIHNYSQSRHDFILLFLFKQF